MKSEAEFVSVSRKVLGSEHHRRAARDLLDSWFRIGLGRSDVPLCHCEGDFGIERALWSARIYKRGLRAIQTDAGEVLVRAESSSELRSGLNLIPQFSRMGSVDLLEAVLQDLESGWVCILDAGFLERWPEWQKKLGGGVRNCLVYRPSESTKELETLAQWWSRLHAVTCRGASNDASLSGLQGIWSIGGGITTDMGGFFAGLLGIPHRASPTTFLSAADASVGGKTGVNFGRFGKNQLGLFTATERWVLVPEHFRTLSNVDVACGLAETVKHFWLVGCGVGDPEFLVASQIVGRMRTEPGIACSVFEDLFQLVQFNFAVKSAFVKEDPFENGIRKALNLGHTTAHLIEGLGEAGHLPSMPHGLAVALGMMFLSRAGFVAIPDALEALVQSIFELSSVAIPMKLQAARGDSEQVALVQQLLVHDKKNDRTNHSGRIDSEPSITLSVPKFGQFSQLVGQNSGSFQTSEYTRRVSLDLYLQKLKICGVLET
jgi:3-dehydroquinate synthase